MEKEYVDVSKMKIRQIDKLSAAMFIKKHHYTKKSSSCRYALGLYYVEEKEHPFFNAKIEILIGVMTYGHPVSNRTVASITKEIKLELDEVLELTRLVCLPDYGTNTESWFIGQSFKWLKKYAPEVKVLVSYADPEQSHTGGIYRATNWMYQGCGVSKLMPDFSILLEEDGLWMHSRTVGSKFGNKSIDNLAKKIGKTFLRKEETAKHRYIYFLCDKKEKKKLISDLKIPILPYTDIKEYEQLIQKVIVKDGKVESIEILQGKDNGWVNKQGQENGTEEEESQV